MQIQTGHPAIPIERGVRAIYEELRLCPDLETARNLYLWREPAGPPGTVREKVFYENARKHHEEIGITLDPRRSSSTTSAMFNRIALRWKSCSHFSPTATRTAA